MANMKRALFCAVLVVTACCFAEDAGRELLQPRNDVPGLANFAKVSGALYRGAQPEADGFAQLKKMGVKTIVNLRSMHSDREKLPGLDLQYFHINCKAWHPEEEDVVAFLKIVGDPKNQPVFVHCQHGSDRTGMMVAAYRIVEQNWSVDDAAKETRNFGFHEIFASIQSYLQKLKPDAVKEKVRTANAQEIGDRK